MNKQTNTLFLLVMLVGIILSACTVGQPAKPEEATVEVVEIDTAVSMADRNRFHDRIIAKEASAAESNEVAGSGAAMAARIRFHDKLWERKLATEDASNQLETNVEVTMADRIRFHDRLWIRALGSDEMSQADRIRFHDRLWEGKR